MSADSRTQALILDEARALAAALCDFADDFRSEMAASRACFDGFDRRMAELRVDS